jgi:hypothetical protein
MVGSSIVTLTSAQRVRVSAQLLRIQQIGFALDSPLEEAGFEPLVPRDTTKVSRGLTSPLLDLPVTGRSARTTTEINETPGFFGGTDGSNPVPSRG